MHANRVFQPMLGVFLVLFISVLVPPPHLHSQSPDRSSSGRLMGLPPDPPILFAPANGAIDIVTNPIMQWNFTAGATSYRLQMATTSNFSNPTFDQTGLTGTQTTVQGLLVGTKYYWRMTASNAAGASGWSAVWSFTTVGPALPAAPILEFPGNGDQNISIDPRFRWHPAAGALSYHIQASTDSLFVFNVIDAGGETDTTHIFPGLDYSAKYFWRVSGVNGTGQGPWSAVWSFRTEQLAPPPAPLLNTPVDGAVDVAPAAPLAWHASSGAAWYRLQVSIAQDFSTTVYDQAGINGTSTSVPGIAVNTKYYWRVNAGNAGGTSAWSTVWSFTTLPAPPPAPLLSLPANGATNVSQTPTLVWFPAAGAATYRVQISITVDFLSTVFDQAGLTATNVGAAGLTENATYFWRANGANAGGEGPWSQVWTFQTAPRTDVRNEMEPTGFDLYAAYPNPFSDGTVISWNIPHSGGADTRQRNGVPVMLKIFDLLGREVADLTGRIDGGNRVTLDRKDLPSAGVFFARLNAGSEARSLRLICLR